MGGVRHRTIRALVAAIALIACAPSGATARDALPWLHAVRGDEARFSDAHGRQVVLRGVNVAQLNDYATLNAHPPNAPPLARSDFEQMRALGFNSVRLLIAWSRLEPQPGKVDQRYLDEVARAVGWAKANDLYVVIDMHQDAWSKFTKAPPGTQCPPGSEPSRGWDGAPAWATLDDGMPRCAPGGVRDLAPAVIQSFESFWLDRPPSLGQPGIQTRFIAAWQQVAKRFANEPAVAGYDILNEPHPGWQATGAEAATVGRMYQRVVPAIRAVDKRHTIFLEPSVLRSAVSAAVVMPPAPDDENLAYAPHIYGDLAYGEAQQSEWDNADREARSGGGARGKLPLWVGEFPMLDTPDGGKRYNAAFQRIADANIGSWSHWVWKETCGNPHEGYGPVPPSSVVAYDCKRDVFTRVKANRIPYLSTPYPRFAPGRATRMAFDQRTKRFELTGANPGGAGAPLEVEVPLRAHYGGAVQADGSGLSEPRIERRGDGTALLRARAGRGDWSLVLTRAGSRGAPQAIVRLPVTRFGCTRRRRINVKLRAPRGQRIVRAHVKLNNKRVRVRKKGRRMIAKIDLRRVRGKRAKIRVAVRTHKRKRLTQSRSYRLCG